MSTKEFVCILYVLMVLSLVVTVDRVSAAPLVLTVSPNRHWHNVGEKVIINGNLTEGGSPVSNAIVAIQVDNPNGSVVLVRTINTGSLNPNKTWPVEILELTPCTGGGTPNYDFDPGDLIGFKVKIRNNAASPYDIIIVLTLTYSNKAPFTSVDGTPLGPLFVYNGSIGAGVTQTISSYSAATIPNDAVTGNTTVHANIYDVLPGKFGFAFCPEVSATFLIGSSGGGESTTTSGNGEFTLEISLSRILVWLGNYTVHATTMVNFSVAFATSQFGVTLPGDLTGPQGVPDGKVDMRDIALVARAFGTQPGDPYWNPIADLTGPEGEPDGRVDMRDVAYVARNFGAGAAT